MPITFATLELREMMERNNGTPKPNRRNLIYHVTCPVNEEPCQIQECEYQQCVSAATEDLDNEGQPLEPKIHITAIPQKGEPHSTTPIDYNHQWLKAVAEAALMMDQERLEKLDEIQKIWLGPVYEKEARTVLVEAMSALVDSTSESSIRNCRTCSKQHLLSYSDDCPGCLRLLDPDAERQEYISRAKEKVAQLTRR